MLLLLLFYDHVFNFDVKHKQTTSFKFFHIHSIEFQLIAVVAAGILDLIRTFRYDFVAGKTKTNYSVNINLICLQSIQFSSSKNSHWQFYSWLTAKTTESYGWIWTYFFGWCLICSRKLKKKHFWMNFRINWFCFVIFCEQNESKIDEKRTIYMNLTQSTKI